MSIAWNAFTPWSSLAGGALIGCAAAMFALLNGRIAGISGILGGLFQCPGADSGWRAAFVLGLIGAPLGSLIGASLVSVPRNLIGLAHEMHVRPTVLLSSLFPWFWRFAIAASIAQSLRHLPWLQTVPGFFVVSAGVALGYGLFLLPLFFREPLDQYTRPLLARLRLSSVAP